MDAGKWVVVEVEPQATLTNGPDPQLGAVHKMRLLAAGCWVLAAGFKVVSSGQNKVGLFKSPPQTSSTIATWISPLHCTLQDALPTKVDHCRVATLLRTCDLSMLNFFHSTLSVDLAHNTVQLVHVFRRQLKSLPNVCDAALTTEEQVALLEELLVNGSLGVRRELVGRNHTADLVNGA